MLSPAQRQAAIAQLQSAAAAARAAIDAQTWFPWEDDAKAQQLGAIRIVEDTSIRSLQNLAAQDSEDADRRFLDLAHTAEDSLSSIKGYAATATLDSVIAATASATGETVGNLAAAPIKAVSSLAGAGLVALWNGIPALVKLAAGGVVAGLAWYYVRPLLPRRKGGA